jgi:hypothetical protein
MLGLIVFLLLWIFLPIKMAKKRGRSKFGWVVVFFIISPLWGSILLAIVGDKDKKIREDIIGEMRQNKEKEIKAIVVESKNLEEQKG